MALRHICFISQEYPPETGWGGIGSYTYEMAHGLANAGHRVTVIARAVNQEQVVNDAGVMVHRLLPTPDWNRLRGGWRVNHFWPGFAWAAMLRVRHIHARTPIDLVEAAECRGDSIFLPWIRNRPRTITRLHTAWIFIDRVNNLLPDRKKRFIYWLERQAILNADMITAPSRAVVDLTSTWLSLTKKKIDIVPNPVNSIDFSPSNQERLNEILFVGRLERNKGAEVLQKTIPYVLNRCPNVNFRFLGANGKDGLGSTWRDRILQELAPIDHARVQFDLVQRSLLKDYYRRASICVLPSLWENFPYTLLEAMSCGTPVVASRTGGIPELIEHGRNGFLVEPSDSHNLADALCDLLEHAERREQLGRSARAKIEASLSVQKVVPRMIDIYESVIALR